MYQIITGDARDSVEHQLLDRSGCVQIVKALLECNQISTGEVDVDGDTLLHIAGRKGDADVIGLLVDHVRGGGKCRQGSLDVNAKNQAGYTGV